MNKEFIPYEQALVLKELGFDEPCFGWWFADEEMLIIDKSTKSTSENIIQAPLYQQAFKFFREKYKLSGTPHYFTGGFYCYTINDMKDTKESNRLFTEFETYKEAELECLKKLIEIVKKK